MTFEETAIPGVFVIGLKAIADDRGYFARTFCVDEFAKAGLDPAVAQINLGRSHRRGTLRGIHFQETPHAEVKLARCTRGAIYDVAVDLRPGSPTHGRWVGRELTADNNLMLYIPEGCAHGYQTLTDDAEMYYQTSKPYAPKAARGVRYDDPAFGIEWPLPVSIISEADRTWPDHVGGRS